MKSGIKKLFIFTAILLLLSGCAPQEKVVSEAPLAPAEPPQASGEFTYDFVALEQMIKELTYIDESGTEQKLFGEGKVVDEEYLEKYMQFDISTLSESFVMRHDDESMAALLMILKPINGDDDAVKTAFDNFLVLYKTQFEGYFPQEYDLVEDYYTVDKGEYVVYIISYNNEAVLTAINKAKISK